MQENVDGLISLFRNMRATSRRRKLIDENRQRKRRERDSVLIIFSMGITRTELNVIKRKTLGR